MPRTTSQESLAGLSAADLIRERTADPDLEYIFKHALTQEVAYDGLLRRDRQLLHERVAQGSRHSSATGRTSSSRRSRTTTSAAAMWWRPSTTSAASGRKALDRYTLPEAHRQYRAAYNLLTADDDDTTRSTAQPGIGC